MIKVSKNFTLEELIASDTAKAKGINNTPNSAAVVNLTLLVDKVLQPLRDWWGKAIAVGSGYRSVALNNAVGGVSNSQHMKGMAVDLCLPLLANGKQDLEAGKKWFEYIKKHLPFDQVIWEHNSKGSYWVHVSFCIDGNRRQAIDNLLKK